MAENDQGNTGSDLSQGKSIHRLPSELLTKIFSYLSTDGHLQLRHALLVCHFWYNNMIYNPKLWSIIKFDREFFAQFPRSLRPRAEAFTHLCLERSSPVPLHITLDKFIDSENTREETVERIALVTRMLLVGNPVHARRCVSFSWIMVEPVLETILLGVAFPREFEMLESLYIEGFRSNRLNLFPSFPNCPTLKEVHLFNHKENRSTPYFPDDDIARVEKLVFATRSAWVDDDITCISRFASIHTLVLRDLSSADGVSRWDLEALQSTALLPSLKKLELVGLVLCKFLIYLDAPFLQEVQIEEGEPGKDSLTEIPSRILQSVTSIIIISSSFFPTSWWSSQLYRITEITSAPSLKVLTLSSLLHEALGNEEWYIELACRLQLCIK
jgi:hypothetical protein